MDLTFWDLVSRSGNVSSLWHRAPLLRVNYISFPFAFFGLTRKGFPALLIIRIINRFLSLCCYEQFFCMDIARDNVITKYVVNSSQKNPFQIQPLNPRVSKLHLLYAMISCLPKIYFNIIFIFPSPFNSNSDQNVSTGLHCRPSLSVHLFLHFVSVLIQISWPSTAIRLLLTGLEPRF